MDAPPLFGCFHITASILAAALAVLAAVIFARRADSVRDVRKILTVTGWILIILEIYKQLFLFCIVNSRAFDWWFFPFQLCSVPMYLCVLLPFIRKPVQNAFLTFMGGYTFVSAAAALIYPEDILRPFLALTVHGFIWHGLLLFISLYILLTGSAYADVGSLRSAAGLFAVLCVIAVSINAAVEPVMPAIRAAHPAVMHDWAAMFYLNPFHISPQPVVSAIQNTAGIPAGLLLYVLVIAAVSSLLIRLFGSSAKRTVPNGGEDDL